MTEPRITITVDRDRCMGSGVCQFQAPNTFDMDDDCKSVVLDTRDPIDIIRDTAAACPQDAIILTEEH